MFCPNCGTQNPDAAQTCSKCNFNIKGAAAPKFKGTMLMMNQPIPGAPPGVGPASCRGRAAGGGCSSARRCAHGRDAGRARYRGARRAARAAGASSAVPSKLKGTMVGVAPMSRVAARRRRRCRRRQRPPSGFSADRSDGSRACAADAAADSGAPSDGRSAHGGAAAAGPPPGFDPQQPPGYAPPYGGQQGVNPLGGTVAADGGGFAAYAQQAAAAATPNPYAQPGQGAPYGQPPPQQYGAPPGGAPYGTTPNPYGAPPQGQQGYGAPQQGQPPPGYGNPMSPQGGMMPYGGAAPANPMIGTLPSAGGVVVGPTRRNALMTFLLPIAVIFGGSILGTLLAIVVHPIFGLVSTLSVLGGSIWYLLFTIQMVNELKAVTQNASFAWWPVLIPFYNYYWLLILLPQEVTKAKQMRGVQAPTRNIILYFFLGNFALASDLNDMAR